MCWQCRKKKRKFGITYEPIICWDYVWPVLALRKLKLRFLRRVGKRV